MAVVRAKVYVAELIRQAYNPGGTQVVLRAATSGSEENKQWALATPYAEFKLTIKNPLAADVFDQALGKEFYVDFTPAEPEA